MGTMWQDIGYMVGLEYEIGNGFQVLGVELLVHQMCSSLRLAGFRTICACAYILVVIQRSKFCKILLNGPVVLCVEGFDFMCTFIQVAGYKEAK